MNRKVAIFAVIIFFLAFVRLCNADEDTTCNVVSEGSYFMCDGETSSVAEQRAYENALRAAVEQAGVYVESYSKINNLAIAKDEVHVISSGVLKPTVMDVKRIATADTVQYWCKIKCVVQVASISSMKERLRDKQLSEQYSILQERFDKLDCEHRALKQQLENSSGEQDKKQIEYRVSQNGINFMATMYAEKAYVNNLNNEYDEAIIAADQAISFKDNNSEAYLLRAMAYYGKKQYDKSISDYSQSIKLSPTYALAYNNRGNAYLALKLIKQAIADYSKSLTIKADNAVVYNNRGIAYSYAGCYNLAVSDCTQALTISPGFADAYYVRGMAYEDLEQYPAALSDYTNAVKFGLRTNMIYNNRGSTYAILKQYELALSDFSQAIKIAPDNPAAYYMRGTVYLLMNKFDSACEDYSVVIKLDSSDQEAYYKRGYAYYMQSNLYQAECDWRMHRELGGRKPYYGE